MKTWQVLNLWGIPFYIHPNWTLLLFLFSWSISNQIKLTSSEIYNIKECWLIGFFSAFLLLITILLNQIPHTFVSLREGVKIKKVTFFFLGAICQTDKECQNALGNIKISIVRPLFYFFTSLILFLLSYSITDKEQIIINIISRVGILNLFLGCFNLIPMSSLDGGILFKNIIWYLSGSKNKGRILLNKLTLYISFLILIFGIFLMFNASFYYGFLMSMIGLFGINSSKSESQFLKIESILRKSKISELKLTPLRRLEFDMNLREFNKLSQASKDKSDNYFFITNNGRWDGFLSYESLRDVAFKKWESSLVGDYKKPIKDFPSESSETPLWKIINKLEKTNQGMLLVVNSLGIPQGLIDRDNIGYFILDKIGFNLSFELKNKLKMKNKYPLGLELPRIIKLMKKNGDL